MSALFVAGAGTDIGKTFVTARLIRRLKAQGRAVQALKPVASGLADPTAPGFATSDTATLVDALGLPLGGEAIAACTPWRFAAALSPDMAAAAENRALPFVEIRDWCQARVAAAGLRTLTLVEGVGGVMSPIAEDALNLDLILALGCPVVLVCGAYLGAISHGLTAWSTLIARGVTVAAVVVNEGASPTVDLDATRSTFQRFAPTANFVPLRKGGDFGPLAFLDQEAAP